MVIKLGKFCKTSLLGPSNITLPSSITRILSTIESMGFLCVTTIKVLSFVKLPRFLTNKFSCLGSIAE